MGYGFYGGQKGESMTWGNVNNLSENIANDLPLGSYVIIDNKKNLLDKNQGVVFRKLSDKSWDECFNLRGAPGKMGSLQYLPYNQKLDSKYDDTSNYSKVEDNGSWKIKAGLVNSADGFEKIDYNLISVFNIKNPIDTHYFTQFNVPYPYINFSFNTTADISNIGIKENQIKPFSYTYNINLPATGDIINDMSFNDGGSILLLNTSRYGYNSTEKKLKFDSFSYTVNFNTDRIGIFNNDNGGQYFLNSYISSYDSLNSTYAKISNSYLYCPGRQCYMGQQIPMHNMLTDSTYEYADKYGNICKEYNLCSYTSVLAASYTLPKGLFLIRTAVGFDASQLKNTTTTPYRTGKLGFTFRQLSSKDSEVTNLYGKLIGNLSRSDSSNGYYLPFSTTQSDDFIVTSTVILNGGTIYNLYVWSTISNKNNQACNLIGEFVTNQNTGVTTYSAPFWVHSNCYCIG